MNELSEEAYLESLGFNPENYEVVVFPESQDYMGYDEDDASLINDEVGLDLYGSGAYIIIKGLEPFDDDDDEDEFPNLSEDELRDMCNILTQDFNSTKAKLDVATELLNKVFATMGRSKLIDEIGLFLLK